MFSPDTLVFPRMAVLPMWWAHALFWCQVIHQIATSAAGPPLSTMLRDRAPPPDLSSLSAGELAAGCRRVDEQEFRPSC